MCREVGQLPLRPFTPTEATELTDVLARQLGVNPSEISLAALEAAWFTNPKYLEFVMRSGAREMKWFVSGRRSPDGKHEVIRPDRWAFLTLDIERQVARELDGKFVYADLKGAFSNDLTEEEWQSVRDQLAPPSPAPVPKAGSTVPTAGTPQPDATTGGADLGKQENSKRRKTRRPEPQTDAEIKSKITAVLSAADKKWPTAEELPPTAYQAAKLLVAGQPGHRLHGYSEVTVRKILAGTYNPMSKHDLTGRY